MPDIAAIAKQSILTKGQRWYDAFMFLLGDKVMIDEEFDGSVTVAGFSGQDIEDWIFEVVSFEEFQEARPEVAKRVKNGPTKSDIFLIQSEHIEGQPLPDRLLPFVMYPSTALSLVEQAQPICRCPIKRLWGGAGHYTGCAEKS